VPERQKALYIERLIDLATVDIDQLQGSLCLKCSRSAYLLSNGVVDRAGAKQKMAQKSPHFVASAITAKGQARL